MRATQAVHTGGHPDGPDRDLINIGGPHTHARATPSGGPHIIMLMKYIQELFTHNK